MAVPIQTGARGGLGNMISPQKRRRCCECTEWKDAHIDETYLHLGPNRMPKEEAPRYCTVKEMYVQPLCFCNEFRGCGRDWERLTSIFDLNLVFRITAKNNIELKHIDQPEPHLMISSAHMLTDEQGVYSKVVHKIFDIYSSGEISPIPHLCSPSKLIEYLMLESSSDTILWRVRK